MNKCIAATFKVAAMHYHNIILFFEPALVLVDLAFERFDREIDRLLETFAPALGHQVVSRNMEVDRGDFISEFVVFIQFQYDVGSDSPFDKTVEFVHFVLYEFDQLPCRRRILRIEFVRS